MLPLVRWSQVARGDVWCTKPKSVVHSCSNSTSLLSQNRPKPKANLTKSTAGSGCCGIAGWSSIKFSMLNAQCKYSVQHTHKQLIPAPGQRFPPLVDGNLAHVHHILHFMVICSWRVNGYRTVAEIQNLMWNNVNDSHHIWGTHFWATTARICASHTAYHSCLF